MWKRRWLCGELHLYVWCYSLWHSAPASLLTVHLVDSQDVGHMRMPLSALRHGHIHVEGLDLSSSALTIVVHEALARFRESVLAGKWSIPKLLRVYYDNDSRHAVKSILHTMEPSLNSRVRRPKTGRRYLVVDSEDVLSFVTAGKM